MAYILVEEAFSRRTAPRLHIQYLQISLWSLYVMIKTIIMMMMIITAPQELFHRHSPNFERLLMPPRGLSSLEIQNLLRQIHRRSLIDTHTTQSTILRCRTWPTILAHRLAIISAESFESRLFLYNPTSPRNKHKKRYSAYG